ncbi:MAG TPA: hypothetical protein VIJ27_01865 [Mucilaginibacter sp.]
MTTQFITNNKGEKTAVIIPVSEYEDLLHQHHLNLDLTDGYKTMMEQENSGKGEYISFNYIKERFQHK